MERGKSIERVGKKWRKPASFAGEHKNCVTVQIFFKRSWSISLTFLTFAIPFTERWIATGM